MNANPGRQGVLKKCPLNTTPYFLFFQMALACLKLVIHLVAHLSCNSLCNSCNLMYGVPLLEQLLQLDVWQGVAVSCMKVVALAVDV